MTGLHPQSLTEWIREEGRDTAFLKLPCDVDTTGLEATVQRPELGIWTLIEEPTGGKWSRDRDTGDCQGAGGATANSYGVSSGAMKMLE